MKWLIVHSSTGSECKTGVLQKTTQYYAGGVRIVTTIFRKPPNDKTIKRAYGKYLKDARATIFKWHAGERSDRRSPSTELSSDSIRLDRQGILAYFE